MLLTKLHAIKSTSQKLDLLDLSVLQSNLVFAYQIMVASENLIRVACSLAEDAGLIAFFKKHLEEEKDHATLLAEDLLTSGVEVGEEPVHTSARCIAGAAYYDIFHSHPAALLGYMLALEFDPAPIAGIEELENKHGKDLLRMARHHAVHDVEHCKELLEQIESLDAPLREIATNAAIRTTVFLSTVRF